MAVVSMLFGNALAAGATGFVAGAFNPLTFGILTAGQLIGNALTPRQVVGRISDVGVQSVTEGAPIKKGYGQFSWAGAVVWSDGKTEHLEETGGKGSPPGPTVATYTTSLQVLLGDASLGNRVERPLKVYLNQHVAYSYNDGDEDGGHMEYDEDNGCWSLTSGLLKDKFRLYDGSQTEVDSHVAAVEAKIYKKGETDDLSEAYQDYLEAIDEDNITAANIPMPLYVDKCVVVIEKLELTEFGNDIPNVRVVVQMEKKTPREIVEDIAKDASLKPEEFDASLLDDLDFDENRLLGFIRPDVSPAKSYLEQVSAILWCDFISVNARIEVKPRDTEPVIRFKESDLKWAYNDSSEALNSNSPQITIERARARDAAGRVEWNFMDPARRFNPGLRRATRQGGDLRNVISTGVPVAQSGGWAQTCANVDLWRQSVENQTLTGTSEWSKIWLAPGDVIELERSNGEILEYRIVQRICDLIGTLGLIAVSHDGKIYRLGESSNTGSYSSAGAAKLTAPILFGASAPALSDSRGNLGGRKYDEMLKQPVFWAGMTVPQGSKWTTATVGLCNLDDGYIDEKADLIKAEIDGPSSIGFLTEEFAVEGPDNGWRDVSLTIRMYRGELASCTREQAESLGANILLFETGRFLQYQDAESNGTFISGGRTVEEWVLTGVYEGFAGSDFEESAPSGVVPDNTRVLLITNSEGVIHTGVDIIDVDYDNPPAYNEMAGRFYGYGSEYRSTRELVRDYIPMNVVPLPPVINEIHRDGTGITVIGWPSTRIYYDGAWETTQGGVLSEPLKSKGYEFRCIVCDKTLTPGHENAANSKPFARWYTDEGEPFEFKFTNAELASVPGLGAGDPVRVLVAMVGEYKMGRRASKEEED